MTRYVLSVLDYRAKIVYINCHKHM